MGRARSAEEFAELERRAGYTAGEVLWLLSLSHRAAVEIDEGLSAASEPLLVGSGGGDASEGRVLTVLRRVDVHHAAQRATNARDRRIAALHAQGYTTREVAALVETSHATVSRRYRATLEEVLRELAAPSG